MYKHAHPPQAGRSGGGGGGGLMQGVPVAGPRIAAAELLRPLHGGGHLHRCVHLILLPLDGNHFRAVALAMTPLSAYFVDSETSRLLWLKPKQ